MVEGIFMAQNVSGHADKDFLALYVTNSLLSNKLWIYRVSHSETSETKWLYGVEGSILKQKKGA